LIDRDWRLRYRMDPDYGFIDAGWPASVIGFTEADGRRPRPGDPQLGSVLS
jgi:hypothetical protein